MIRSSAAGTRIGRRGRSLRPGGGDDTAAPLQTGGREHGLELLGRRDFTRRGMLQRLLADGYASEAAADAVEYLTESSYLDDRRFAERFLASARARKGHGRAWLERELASQGVPRDVIAAVLAEGRDRDTERDEALTLAKELMRRSPALAPQRLASRLAARGFSWEVVRATLDELDKGAGELPED